MQGRRDDQRRRAGAGGLRSVAGAAFASPFLPHGYTPQGDLQRKVDAGRTPQQAPMTATVHSGRVVKRIDLAGPVGIRRKADLVRPDGHPSAGIAAMRRIDAVVANGRWFSRAALDARRRDVEERAAK